MAERDGEHPRMTEGRGRLAGKVAAVTAADSGIGRASARLFAREGAKVVCADVAERGEPRVDRLIESDGGEARFVLGDVSRKAACEEVVGTAIAEFGGLDVLFLNAGTGVRRKIHEMTDEEWDHVVQLNLNGVYHGVRAALPHFMERGSGNIVITASSLGVLASPRYPAYSATKAALINLTRQLAVDYGTARSSSPARNRPTSPGTRWWWTAAKRSRRSERERTEGVTPSGPGRRRRAMQEGRRSCPAAGAAPGRGRRGSIARRCGRAAGRTARGR